MNINYYNNNVTKPVFIDSRQGGLLNWCTTGTLCDTALLPSSPPSIPPTTHLDVEEVSISSNTGSSIICIDTQSNLSMNDTESVRSFVSNEAFNTISYESFIGVNDCEMTYSESSMISRVHHDSNETLDGTVSADNNVMLNESCFLNDEIVNTDDNCEIMEVDVTKEQEQNGTSEEAQSDYSFQDFGQNFEDGVIESDLDLDSGVQLNVLESIDNFQGILGIPNEELGPENNVRHEIVDGTILKTILTDSMIENTETNDNIWQNRVNTLDRPNASTMSVMLQSDLSLEMTVEILTNVTIRNAMEFLALDSKETCKVIENGFQCYLAYLAARHFQSKESLCHTITSSTSSSYLVEDANEKYGIMTECTSDQESEVYTDYSFGTNNQSTTGKVNPHFYQNFGTSIEREESGFESIDTTNAEIIQSPSMKSKTDDVIEDEKVGTIEPAESMSHKRTTKATVPSFSRESKQDTEIQGVSHEMLITLGSHLAQVAPCTPKATKKSLSSTPSRNSVFSVDKKHIQILTNEVCIYIHIYSCIPHLTQSIMFNCDLSLPFFLPFFYLELTL